MEQDIESSLTQDNFSLNHDIDLDLMPGGCASVLESSGNDNFLSPSLQCTGNDEEISLKITDILLDFATRQRTEGIEFQQDNGFTGLYDLSAPVPNLGGDFELGNEFVCLETNLISTDQQPSLQNQSGWTDNINDQECLNQSDVQQQDEKTILMNTKEQPRVTCLQNQSGWIDSLNDQECFNTSDVQEQNKTNNETSETSSNEERMHSVRIYQSEYRLHQEKKSKTTDAKKRKNAQVHF